jgi:hypothetical protein
MKGEGSVHHASGSTVHFTRASTSLPSVAKWNGMSPASLVMSRRAPAAWECKGSKNKITRGF